MKISDLPETEPKMPAWANPVLWDAMTIEGKREFLKAYDTPEIEMYHGYTQAQVNDAGTARYYQQAQLTMPEGYPQQHWDTLNGNEKADVVERASYEKHMARLAALDAKARRDRIAEMALQGLLAGGAHKDYGEAHIIAAAISYTENLIAELDRA